MYFKYPKHSYWILEKFLNNRKVNLLTLFSKYLWVIEGIFKMFSIWQNIGIMSQESSICSLDAADYK